jgi:hypothetical protein
MRDSVHQEVEQVTMAKPHVVIIGAGCSRAALPEGDAHGARIPLMQDFFEIVQPLKDLYEAHGFPIEGQNLEEIYSQCAGCAPDVQQEAEAIIYRYFRSLVLPQRPTLYDYLVLCLRQKDIIATFNWDPFLVQAIRRNPIVTSRAPQLLFLHGNVMVGFCKKDSIQGAVGESCHFCGVLFEKSKLLYPIAEKNYDADPMISASWKQLRLGLQHSFMVTFFGYGAPKSDVTAIELLKVSLGDSSRRQLNAIEIIDVKPEEELREAWKDFIQIHNHHYRLHKDFYNSHVARHPRRTGEAYINQYIKGEWISDNLIPAGLDFVNLWEWMAPLLEAERLSRGAGTD